SPLVTLLTCSCEPALTVVVLPALPRAVPLVATCRTPELGSTVTAPWKPLLSPDSTRVPTPRLVRPTVVVLLILPERVRAAPLLTVMTSTTPAAPPSWRLNARTLPVAPALATREPPEALPRVIGLPVML